MSSKKKLKQGLTRFELIISLLLTFSLILIILKTKLYLIPHFVVYSFFLRLFLPFDSGINITVYPHKVLNFLWHFTILFVIFENKELFQIDKISWWLMPLAFFYFHLMRFLGSLILKKEPIWLTRNIYTNYSESKKREIKTADRIFIAAYIGIELLVLYFNDAFKHWL